MTRDLSVSRMDNVTSDSLHPLLRDGVRPRSRRLQTPARDLVEEDRTGQIANKPGRVSAHESECGGVIQGEVLGSGRGRDRLNERGFAGLTGAIEQNDGGIRQGVLDRGFELPPNNGDIFTGSW